MIDASRHGHRNALVLGLAAVQLTIVVAILLIIQTPPPSERAVIGLVSFVLMAVLLEAFPMAIPLSRAHLSLSGTIFTALILLFEPAWVAVGTFTTLAISESLFNKRSWIKKIFNTSQASLSALVSSILFVKIHGGPGLSNRPSFFAAAALAVLAYWILNTWLVSIGAGILYSQSPLRFWRANFSWAFIYELTSAPVALAVAYAYQALWIVGLGLITLPLFLVRLAFIQYLELKKTYRETVRTLVKIIEMHDPYTAGHSDRVATYARRLCEALRLSPSITEKVELAAYLHDLGKIHLDLTNVIRKAGKLNEEERRLIRLHSVVSADLANQVSYFKGEIEMMIRHHHENWDGSGYPHGLREEQIPLGSRIILIADAFDAMTTSRVYRDALDLEKVKGEFRKFAGIQFDPELVPTFLEDVVGDGTGVIKQPMNEPLEGQRARAQSESPAVVKNISVRGVS